MSVGTEKTAATSIIERLKNAGIGKVYLIDDAYVDPTVEEAEDRGQFVLDVRADPEAKAELAKFKEVHTEDDLDNEVVKELWKRREEKSKLCALAREHLFGARARQRDDLTALEGHLKAIGLEPISRGPSDPVPPDAKLIFLDYVLDPRVRADPTTLDGFSKLGVLATDRAKQLYKAAGDETKPFIVLMSDKPSIGEHQDLFRNETELLAGLFAFISKGEALSPDTLALRLGTWGVGNEYFAGLQRFVMAVVAGAHKACEDFVRRVRALDVNDYSFIQRLSLHREGHPLGDYLMWLFESSLGHSLRANEQIQLEQEKLDLMRFARYIPSRAAPSDRAAKFYATAVTEPAVTDVKPQPLDPDKKVPLLFLGDVFYKDAASNVLMIVTAACDLTFRPLRQPGSDDNQPVYLIPGHVRAVTETSLPGRVSTDVVVIDKLTYGVDWDYKHVHSAPLGGVWDYLKREKYRRVSRLRLPYALRVQQAFANHVTRLGLPVAPPMFREAKIEVFVRGESDAATSVAAVERGAAIFQHDGKEQFVLAGECVDALIELLPRVANEIVKAAQSLPDDKFKERRVKAAGEAAQELLKAKGDSALWLKLLETTFEVPQNTTNHQTAELVVGKTSVDDKLVWAYCCPSGSMPKMQAKPVLAINVVRPG